MKKVLAVALILAMAATFTACKAKNGGANDTKTTTNSTEKETVKSTQGNTESNTVKKDSGTVILREDGEVKVKEMSINKKTYSKEEEIILHIEFEGVGVESWAWVGVIPSEVEHGSETVNDEYDISYKYLGDIENNTVIMNAPADAGKYDLRVNDSDSDTGKEVAYITFEVK